MGQGDEPAGRTGAGDGAARFRRGPINWLILCAGVLIAAIVSGTVVMVNDFRERALTSGERELENTVLLLARHYDQQFADFTAIHHDVVADVIRAGIITPDGFRQQMATLEMHKWLRSKMTGIADVSGVNIFDSDGRRINGSEAWPVRDIDISDRGYFQALKSGSAPTPVQVELVRSKFSGTLATIISRKITGPDGEFFGVVTRGVAPSHFEQLFASVALGQDSAISIHHRDGTLLARYPHVPEQIGRNFNTGMVAQKKVFDWSHGTARLPSPIDGRERLISARALTEFPLVLVATTTVDAKLADWREQVRLLVAVAALSTLVIVFMVFLIVRQMTRQHESSQARLSLQKQRLDTAVNNMTQGLLLFDSSARLVVCNQHFIDMFGLSPEIVKPGCSFRDLIAHRQETGSFRGDVDEYCADFLRKVARDKFVQTVVEPPDGRAIRMVRRTLDDGGWVTTLEDITERRRTEERIVHLAHYDALTDLPNRTLFGELLERELAKIGQGGQLAVLYIDIDEFKSVNDSLGHPIGDELLKAVAARLRDCIGAGDLVARLGGDEFAIVQTGIATDGCITALMARIYDAIRRPYDCLGHQLAADASIGIARAPVDGTDLDQLLKNADLAMYRAKADGRRTFRFFAPEMDAWVRARRTMEVELRQAMLEGGFEIHYQPLVDLRTDEITGCEALLRWRHPLRGMISPAEFIPVAEETGLITQLGEWVLATACAEAATWPAHIKLAVNVSPIQFRSGTLALKVAAAIAASGLSASRLELEITEAVLIHDDEIALAILHQLRSLGVRIALDDFGTGYSSLSYLQRFPFDKIKIDRCFVADIEQADGSAPIVQAVVNIASARNMTTTAEGVETQEQCDILRALGCTEMQGFLFSRPKPAAEIRPMLEAPARRTAVV
ncbi:EAL domain-containing protein [Rhodopseudomonas sp.]|uniref:bifunctional diguanylate cyclase/phosphodiesterase n=1 Tax=Rhodopseudomonas sp. TaxID=1078 RepID=UPI0025F2FB78|nr:EAL domain-containing protein [Rhodopseudomonas sp.]